MKLSEEDRCELATRIVRYLTRLDLSGIGHVAGPTSLDYIDLSYGECDILEWINGALEDDT